MLTIDYIILIFGVLLILSILTSGFLSRYGIPALLIFLAIGMLAGVDGPGGINFDDANLARSLGILALIFILFSGGLETKIEKVKVVLWQGISLSTLGVLLTALLMGSATHFLFNLSWLESFLLGAIISSTDAAAVFRIFRSKNFRLKGHLSELLELESGSNDPMAVFLTLGFMSLITEPQNNWHQLIPDFFIKMGLGFFVGFLLAKLSIPLLKSLKNQQEGMIPPLFVGIGLAIYSLTTVVGGNGFIAVYLAGIIIGNAHFPFKNTLTEFQNSLTWLFEVLMFLVLGLLVYPSRIVPVIPEGLMISMCLIFVARPLSVFVSLLFARLNFREKLMISWTGLRGAAPIILATFPLLAHIPHSEVFFNIVFFIVLTSVLLQGTFLPLVARLLKLNEPLPQRRVHHLQFAHANPDGTRLEEFIIPYTSQNVGKRISELPWPKDSLAIMIYRGDDYFVPQGSTKLEAGDVILVVISEKNQNEVSEILIQ